MQGLELDAIAAELARLVELVDDLELVREGEGLRVAPTGGGEAVEVELSDEHIELGFGGWREFVDFEDDPKDSLASVLDFVAAAVFGELRVTELRLGERVLQRSLACRVDGNWRRHARRGRLGLAGLRARIARRLDQRVRTNEGRVRRPAALRDAGPRGLPSAPWIGAAGSLMDEAGEAEIEIDGELDLHNFSPKEVAPLVREYIEVCRERGILDLRIVHGKGKGGLAPNRALAARQAPRGRALPSRR